MEVTMLNENQGPDLGRESGGSEKNREPHEDGFEIVIIYNGIKKPLKVAVKELIGAVLQRAIALFGSLPNPHTLALYTEGGKELPDNESVQQAGLHPNERLLLRPSTV